MLQGLKRAGIVEATKGAGGGYRLTRPIAEIRFLDVLRPFEDQITAAETHLALLARQSTDDLLQDGLSSGRRETVRAAMSFLHAFVLQQCEGLTVDMCLTVRLPDRAGHGDRAGQARLVDTALPIIENAIARRRSRVSTRMPAANSAEATPVTTRTVGPNGTSTPTA